MGVEICEPLAKGKGVRGDAESEGNNMHRVHKQTITRYLFNRFKEHLQAENQAVATINKAVNSLKVFNDFLLEQKLVEEQHIVLKRDRIKVAYGSESEVEVLTKQQVQQILNYLMNDSNK